MFKRKILSKLEAWKRDERHKPLILRGARQVGKTTVVNEFGSQFDNYLYFNLEMNESVRLFEMDIPLNDLVNMLFASLGKSQREGSTLIFIDEIQNSPKTIALLRYFYEQRPDLYVIAAGSLLENLVDVNVSFPVGRVMYMALRPCSFYEFLGAMGKTNLLAVLSQKPEYTVVFHEQLMHHFNQYTIIGGMPEAVQRYAETQDIVAIEDGEVLVGQAAQVLLTEHIGLALLDGVDAAFVVHLGDETVIQQHGGVVGVVVHHQGDVDGIMDCLVVVVQFFLVGAHVPGSDNHDTVSAVGLSGLAHLDDIAGAVSAG